MTTVEAKVRITGRIHLSAGDMKKLQQAGPQEVLQTLLMHDCQVFVDIDIQKQQKEVEAPVEQEGTQAEGAAEASPD